MKTLVIIPARYASTRFPGKPLALLGGRTIIERVWEAVGQTLGVDRVVVATDDERICDHIENIAGEGAAMMTSDRHHSGTDRCGEVVERLAASGEEYDVVVNVQGDEPFVEPAQIQTLIDTFADSRTDIATLRTPIVDTDELLSPNNVKVVCDRSGNALYFSRQPIPYRRDVPVDQWLAGAQYYKHVGLYAFRSHVLAELCRLEPGTLEDCERLEQLRWLENGHRIKVCTTAHANIGIDTPADLAAAEGQLAAMQQKKRNKTQQ